MGTGIRLLPATLVVAVLGNPDPKGRLCGKNSSTLTGTK